MKIALILENSQAGKNKIIFEELNRAAKAHGHEVLNFGMYTAEDKRCLTYVMNGLLASLVLNCKVADFVVTGCGTGEGACVACNAFPGVQCGHVTSPVDAYLFTQVNAGNAISLPYAQNFGWGGELNLRYTFEKLFAAPFGGGYPPERVEAAASFWYQRANDLSDRTAPNECDAFSLHFPVLQECASRPSGLNFPE